MIFKNQFGNRKSVYEWTRGGVIEWQLADRKPKMDIWILEQQTNGNMAACQHNARGI